LQVQLTVWLSLEWNLLQPRY